MLFLTALRFYCTSPRPITLQGSAQRSIHDSSKSPRLQAKQKHRKENLKLKQTTHSFGGSRIKRVCFIS